MTARPLSEAGEINDEGFWQEDLTADEINLIIMALHLLLNSKHPASVAFQLSLSATLSGIP
jgi:hypothetical protein